MYKVFALDIERHVMLLKQRVVNFLQRRYRLIIKKTHGNILYQRIIRGRTTIGQSDLLVILADPFKTVRVTHITLPQDEITRMINQPHRCATFATR